MKPITSTSTDAQPDPLPLVVSPDFQSRDCKIPIPKSRDWKLGSGPGIANIGYIVFLTTIETLSVRMETQHKKMTGSQCVKTSYKKQLEFTILL